MISIALILQIASFCSTQPPEVYSLCYERVEACYYKHIEITDEEPETIVDLCIGTYLGEKVESN